MPVSIRAHLATQPDSASLESLAMLVDCALASENDVEELKKGVAEIQVSWTAGKPDSQAQEIRDSHSGKEEELRTQTDI